MSSDGAARGGKEGKERKKKTSSTEFLRMTRTKIKFDASESCKSRLQIQLSIVLLGPFFFLFLSLLSR